MERSTPVAVFTVTGRALQLRPMEERDLEQVIAIETLAHSHPWRRASFEVRLQQQDDCRVAVDNNRVLGYAIISRVAGDAELLNIAVNPDCQRQGIARSLLEAMIERASFVAENLFLEVRVSNHKAIEFYNGLDFVEVGCRPNYYPSASGREDALIMSKVLAL